MMRVPAASGGQRIAWIALTIALAGLVVGIAILLRALPTMRYRFAGDRLIVEWLGERRVIPLSEVTEIIYEPAELLRLPRWEPFWPGYYVASVRTPSGVWHSWATQQPHRRVRLMTADGIVAISPDRPVRFIAELDRRHQAAGRSPISINAADARVSPAIEPRPLPEAAPIGPGPAAARATRVPRPPSARRPLLGSLVSYRDLFCKQFLTDPVASALAAAGVILPVLMVAYLYSQYEGLPDQIPIRWDASGEVIGQTGPSGLWRFPRMAVVLLVVNTAIATLLVSIDRYLARLLVAAIPLVHVMLFIALIRAVN